MGKARKKKDFEGGKKKYVSEGGGPDPSYGRHKVFTALEGQRKDLRTALGLGV